MLNKKQIYEFFTCMHIDIKQAEIVFDYVDFYENKADVLRCLKLLLINSFLELNQQDLQELNDSLELFQNKDYNKLRFNFMRSIPVLQVLDDDYYKEEFFNCLVFIANTKSDDKSVEIVNADEESVHSNKTNYGDLIDNGYYDIQQNE